MLGLWILFVIIVCIAIIGRERRRWVKRQINEETLRALRDHNRKNVLRL